MALQIANPVVVAKVERLALATGMTKTALVERAVDQLALATSASANALVSQHRMDALLAQLDRIPVRVDAFDAVAWDEQGLPA